MMQLSVQLELRKLPAETNMSYPSKQAGYSCYNLPEDGKGKNGRSLHQETGGIEEDRAHRGCSFCPGEEGRDDQAIGNGCQWEDP